MYFKKKFGYAPSKYKLSFTTKLFELHGKPFLAAFLLLLFLLNERSNINLFEEVKDGLSNKRS